MRAGSDKADGNLAPRVIFLQPLADVVLEVPQCRPAHASETHEQELVVEDQTSRFADILPQEATV